MIPTLAKNDDARSAHVALTRCETGLRVHTRLERDELLSHLSSPTSLRPKDDALLFEEIVRGTGGPDTFWATSVRSAMAKENDPLRNEHRAEMRQRTEARDRAVMQIVRRYNVERPRRHHRRRARPRLSDAKNVSSAWRTKHTSWNRLWCGRQGVG